MGNPRTPGQVVGAAGGSLTGATWAVSDSAARIGQGGEVRTAALIDELALTLGGPTVLHDLNIPIPGISANIDHLVVSGDKVTILDSKVWKPGRYRNTIRGGGAKRGREKVDHTRKKTMVMAREAIERYLLARGITARFAVPVLIVWPSSTKGRVSTTLLTVPGARVLTGEQFSRKVARTCGAKPADPRIVAALALLVNDTSTSHPRASSPSPAPRPTSHTAPRSGSRPASRPVSRPAPQPASSDFGDAPEFTVADFANADPGHRGEDSCDPFSAP